MLSDKLSLITLFEELFKSKELAEQLNLHDAFTGE